MNLQRAIKEAKRSDHEKYKHATLLFKGSVLVAAGYNQGKKHSEVMAINKIKHKMTTKGLVAFNVRINKLGEVSMSRPCEICACVLTKAGIYRVIFTTNNSGISEESYT